MQRLISFTVESHIAVVRMNAPPVNAQNGQFHDEIAETFDEIGDRDDIRVAVLIGEGKIFSAGADLRSRASVGAQPGGRWRHSRKARESFHAVMECRKPVIAALNGPALGAGLALAASCDILVAAQEACLGLPEIDVGLLGGARHAMRLFGHSLTRRMMLTGYRVPASELYRLGVVEACVPGAELLETAMGLARQIAAKSPIAVRMAKDTLNAIETSSLRDGYRYEQNQTAALGGHPDSREAMAAFVEKRQPVFSGS